MLKEERFWISTVHRVSSITVRATTRAFIALQKTIVAIRRRINLPPDKSHQTDCVQVQEIFTKQGIAAPMGVTRRVDRSEESAFC